MQRVVVAGIGTGVGKTVASAILVHLLSGDYWKPVHCGAAAESDRACVQRWVGGDRARYHAEAYPLAAPASPHHAARLEGVKLDFDRLVLPRTRAPLVIEMTGGILVPFDDRSLLLDFFLTFEADWVLVSRNYLGSINHTLLSAEILASRGIRPIGLIFNGEPNRDSETFIEAYTGLPVLGRIACEPRIDSTTIKSYSARWAGEPFLPSHWHVASHKTSPQEIPDHDHAHRPTALIALCLNTPR
jgi:dethiobiotin synthetase